MEKELKIVCPFCNAPYTAEMEDDLYIAGNCETCCTGVTGSITINCSNCKKVVYKKEF